MEGINDSNWEDYSNLCHDCFAAKFAIRKKQHIGYENSEFDVTKKTDKKRRGGQGVTVQEIKSSGVKRWIIDWNCLHTDVKNKDYKDPNFFKDKLKNEYNYVPYVPPKEKKRSMRKVDCCPEEKTKKIIEEAEQDFQYIETKDDDHMNFGMDTQRKATLDGNSMQSLLQRKQQTTNMSMGGILASFKLVMKEK
eukprot:6575530-Ditylum_brightwellii.AAC.1